jgi:hypothetical protein
LALVRPGAQLEAGIPGRGCRSLTRRRKAGSMVTGMAKYRPAVSKTVLLSMAGILWVGVGTMLLALAFSWLSKAPAGKRYGLAAYGVVLALVVHHFGFLRIVDSVMIALGATLRHSAIPKPYLAILYIGIGLGLLLSSVRYVRLLLGELRRREPAQTPA